MTTPLEIERKFLVPNDDWKQEPYIAYYLRQGYLPDGKRVRTVVSETDSNDRQGIITIKTDIDSKEQFQENFKDNLPQWQQDKFVATFIADWLAHWPSEYSAPDIFHHLKEEEQVSLGWQTLEKKATLNFNCGDKTLAFKIVDTATQQEHFYEQPLHQEKDWSKFLKFAKLHAPRPLGKKEVEYEIDFEEAHDKLQSLERVLEKTRYVIATPYDYKYEVDVYTNLNFVLTTLEIELKTETQKVIIPSWAGEEVSFDNRYKNSKLILSTVPTKHAKPFI